MQYCIFSCASDHALSVGHSLYQVSNAVFAVMSAYENAPSKKCFAGIGPE